MNRMFYEMLILVAVFCFTELLAQIDTTRKEFWPLGVGDTWQYHNQSGEISSYLKVVNEDTVLSNGLSYSKAGVPPNFSTGFDLTRIDSLLRVQWYTPSIAPDSCGGSNSNEFSIYHLNEEDSTAWIICSAFSGHLGEQLVRFNRITTMNISGQLREVMDFDYAGAIQGEDTIWSYGARIVKGIGIVEERYFDGAYYILQGAIIDGAQYGTIVSVNEIPETIPQRITLYQNYPNPFNPSTKIKYEIPEITNVSLIIFNLLGEQVAELVNNLQPPGIYETELNQLI